MKKVNPKRLLPAPVAKNQASFSQKFLVPASRITTKDFAKVEDSVSTPQQKELKGQSLLLKRKFISLTKLFGEKTNLERNKNRRRRIELEKERRQKREEEKESSNTKFNFGASLPKLNLPRTGFLDTIKRFLLYGLLGFAIDKFGPLIPALLGMVTKLKPAFEFFKNVTVGIVGGVVNFIDASYKAYDFVKGKVQEIIGPDKSDDLNSFTDNLGKVLNGAIIAATAILGLGGPLGKLGLDKGKAGAAAAALGLSGAGLLQFRQKITDESKRKKIQTLSRRGTSRDRVIERSRDAKRAAREARFEEEKAEREFRKGKGKITRGFFDPTRTGEPTRGTFAELTKRPARKILKAERDLLRKVTIGGFGGKQDTRTSVQKVFDARAEKFVKLRKKSVKGLPITSNIKDMFNDEFGMIADDEPRRETRKSEIRNIKKGQPVYSPKLGKRTVELAIPGLGRKRFAPDVADALEYMAKNYPKPVQELILENAFKNPELYGSELTSARREMQRTQGVGGKKMPKALSPAEVLAKGKPKRTPLIPDPTSSRIPSKLKNIAKPLRGISKGPLKNILGPLVGGILDFFLSLLFGDPLGLAAAGAVGAGVGAALGGFIGGLLIPVAGGFIGATAGGIGGDILFRSIYESLVTKTKTDERLKKLAESSDKSKRKPSAKPIMPSEEQKKYFGVDPIVTSRFGEMRGNRPHGGTDIAVPTGTPLVAVTDAVIVDYGDLSRSDAKSGQPGGWGNFIVYKDANGYFHLYAHLNSIVKKSGSVKRGEKIATVGNTGRSTGPHLHWEIGTGWTGNTMEGTSDPLSYYSVMAPFRLSGGKQKANVTPPNRNVASGLDNMTDYEKGGDTEIALLPIVDQIETMSQSPSGGGGVIVLNSNTPSIFAPALIG